MMDDLRCEPPPEHRGERWHWLTFKGSKPEPVRLDNGPSGLFWGCGEWRGGHCTPGWAYATGWRYHAPCPVPPAMKDEP